MKPIGPLMREHRLIERMVALLNKEAAQIKETRSANVEFLMEAVDFFRTYADRTHHGKEEDILFRDLGKKKLSAAHKTTMDELVEEHMQARKMVKALLEARDRYAAGKSEALEDIVKLLAGLSAFYPAHISKEDKEFFYPSQDYFSKDEQDAMLAEFWEFDRKLVHEKYQRVVLVLEGKPGATLEPWP